MQLDTPRLLNLIEELQVSLIVLESILENNNACTKHVIEGSMEKVLDNMTKLEICILKNKVSNK